MFVMTVAPPPKKTHLSSWKYISHKGGYYRNYKNCNTSISYFFGKKMNNIDLDLYEDILI